jgi:hypothetical protein
MVVWARAETVQRHRVEMVFSQSLALRQAATFVQRPGVSLRKGDAMSGYDSRADSLAHILAVRDRLDCFAAELLARGQAHDASKFGPEEAGIR